MPYFFKRPLRCIPALLFAIIIGGFSVFFVMYGMTLLFIIHNYWHPSTFFQNEVTKNLAFLAFLVVFIKALLFFKIYKATQLLAISHPHKNTYDLNMRCFSLIYLTRVKRYRPTKIASMYESEFIECIEKTAARFPSDKAIFQTSTWLIRKRNRDLLRSCGFRISEKSKPNENILKNHSVVALAIVLSYGFHSESLNGFKKAKFYQITWKKEDIARLKRATEKRRTVYLEKARC